MMPNDQLAGLKLQLQDYPHPIEDDRWRMGEVDCVKDCHLTTDDLPGLLQIAETWLDDEFHEEAAGEQEQNLPVIAWRAIGQLRATEAIEPLIGLLRSAEDEDEWLFDEFPHVFASIGKASLEPLAELFLDENNLEYARTCAGEAITLIAGESPELRGRAIGVFEAELGKFQANMHSFYGLAVANLLNLKAVEAAGTLEQVYSRDLVDVMMCGEWEAVRRNLGVDGAGLKMPAVPFDQWPAGISPTFAVTTASQLFEHDELDFDLLDQHLHTLGNLFRRSPESTQLNHELMDWPLLFLELAAKYCGVTFIDMQLCDAEEVVFEVFPSKISVSAEHTAEIVNELRYFFDFVHRRFRTEHGAKIARFFAYKSTVEEMKRELADSTNFGLAKSMWAMGTNAGFNMSNEADLAEFVELYNASLNSAMPATPNASVRMTAAEKKSFNKKRKKQLASKLKKRKRQHSC